MGADKLKVLMGRPIPVSKEHGIYVRQPLVKEVVDVGEDEFQQLLLPFILTTDAIFNGAENEEELIEKFHVFDLFFMKTESGKTILDSSVFNGENALEVLRNSLSYFLQSDEIRILENRQKIIINNSYLIDKDEFDKLRKIIQSILGRGDIEFEKPPKDMTKRQKDIWFKLQKGRRRKAEREAIYLQDLINFTSFGGTSYIPFKEIDEMTYFQLHNAYKSIMGVDSYRTGIQYKLSQKFEVKDDIKHWAETIKIGK